MININLLEKKKPLRLPVVLGLDLNEVKIRPIIAVYIFSQIVEMFFIPTIGEGIEELEKANAKLMKKQRALRKEIKNNSQHNELLLEYEKQINKLKEREVQVESIIKQKTNPKNILLALTKVIPETVWINSLVIDKNKKLTVEGASLKYSGLNKFVRKSNELEFFGGSFVTVDSKTSEEEVSGRKFRLQVFKAEAKISSYGNLE
jgi:Tfp pilus assembly protein PilN